MIVGRPTVDSDVYPCLRYSFRSVPYPNITWTREGVLIPNSTNIFKNIIYPPADMENDSPKSSASGLYHGCLLVQLPGRPDLSGFYNLTISNVFGSDTRAIYGDFGVGNGEYRLWIRSSAKGGIALLFSRRMFEPRHNIFLNMWCRGSNIQRESDGRFLHQ